MPLPLKALAVVWVAKAVATTKGYKKLKEKNPELVGKFEDKAKDVSDAVVDKTKEASKLALDKAKHAKDYVFGKPDRSNERDNDNTPPPPEL